MAGVDGMELGAFGEVFVPVWITGTTNRRFATKLILQE